MLRKKLNCIYIKLTDKTNYINEVSLRYAKALMLYSESDEAKILKILSDFKSLIETLNSNKGSQT